MLPTFMDICVSILLYIANHNTQYVILNENDNFMYVYYKIDYLDTGRWGNHNTDIEITLTSTCGLKTFLLGLVDIIWKLSMLCIANIYFVNA